MISPMTYDWVLPLTSGYGSNFEALTLVLTLVLPLVIKSDLISDIEPGLITDFQTCYSTLVISSVFLQLNT